MYFAQPSFCIFEWCAMVWRNLLTKSHNTSSILQLLWYLYIKNYNTMYFNLFSLFFSTTTYFVLYLVWYVYDNTYNLIVDYSLVTQPMFQRQPNPTELRLMDSYIQILCRLQKCKHKVPPPSLAWPQFLRTKLHSPPNGDFCPRIWGS